MTGGKEEDPAWENVGGIKGGASSVTSDHSLLFSNGKKYEAHVYLGEVQMETIIVCLLQTPLHRCSSGSDVMAPTFSPLRQSVLMARPQLPHKQLRL